MGTRGFYCFRYKGLYYVIYNHWDSYPDGLGETLVNQLRNIDPQDLRNMIIHRKHLSKNSSDQTLAKILKLLL